MTKSKELFKASAIFQCCQFRLPLPALALAASLLGCAGCLTRFNFNPVPTWQRDGEFFYSTRYYQPKSRSQHSERFCLVGKTFVEGGWLCGGTMSIPVPSPMFFLGYPIMLAENYLVCPVVDTFMLPRDIYIRSQQSNGEVLSAVRNDVNAILARGKALRRTMHEIETGVPNYEIKEENKPGLGPVWVISYDISDTEDKSSVCYSFSKSNTNIPYCVFFRPAGGCAFIIGYHDNGAVAWYRTYDSSINHSNVHATFYESSKVHEYYKTYGESLHYDAYVSWPWFEFSEDGEVTARWSRSKSL